MSTNFCNPLHISGLVRKPLLPKPLGHALYWTVIKYWKWVVFGSFPREFHYRVDDKWAKLRCLLVFCWGSITWYSAWVAISPIFIRRREGENKYTRKQSSLQSFFNLPTEIYSFTVSLLPSSSRFSRGIWESVSCPFPYSKSGFSNLTKIDPEGQQRPYLNSEP